MPEKTPNHMISEIKLPEELSKSYTVFDQNNPDGQKETIPNLSKVNLFIGANNSGKSRFLRGVFGEATLRLFYEEHDIGNFIKVLNSLENLSLQEFTKRNISDLLIKLSDPKNPFLIYQGAPSPGGIRTIPSVKKLLEVDMFDSNYSFIDAITILAENLTETNEKNIEFSPIKHSTTVGTDFLMGKIEKIFRNASREINALTTLMRFLINRLYIPTLRGLRPFDKTEGTANSKSKMIRFDNLYKIRTSDDYFSNRANKSNLSGGQIIFTGIEMFEEVFTHLLSHEADRNLVKEYEKFLSDNFFEGQDFSLIPNVKVENNDVLYVKLGNEEYPIHQLGDGIQQLIIMTFPLFLYKENNLLLFIEEPELYLHPGMQRQLMEILLDKDRFPNVQTFVTTHSNHLLDLTLDLDNISVYKFRKTSSDNDNPQFRIDNTSNSDKSLLQELGVKSSSVFLANCTIWVEGITDRWYIRRYLKLYMENSGLNKFKEDYHYAFVEYGGSNLPHWSFLDAEEKPINVDSICKDSLLIMDRDGWPKKKNNKIDRLQSDPEVNLLLLPCREIENLLCPKVLTKIVQYRERKNEADLSEILIKNTRDDYLGSSIEKQLQKYSVENPKKYAAESGTIEGKRHFAEQALKHIKKFENMTEEAQNLAKDIYEFIKRCNPN